MNLAIGTANFNQPYGRKQTQAKGIQILNTARKLGIDMIDMSPNYGAYLDFMYYEDLVDSFKIIFKVSTIEHLEKALSLCDKHNIYSIMAHGYEAWQKLGHMMSNLIPPNIKIGASLYKPEELDAILPSILQIVEIPVNLADQKWIPMLPHLRIRRIEVVARSLFLHGTLFESKWKGYPLALYSYNMVRANNGIDRIIVGVDTPEQLEEIASYPELEVNYEHLSNNRSKKWLIPIAKQNLPLFSGENSFGAGNREGVPEQVCGQGDSGDNATDGGQASNTAGDGE